MFAKTMRDIFRCPETKSLKFTLHIDGEKHLVVINPDNDILINGVTSTDSPIWADKKKIIKDKIILLSI